MAGFGNQEERAREFIAEGEKTLKKWSLLGGGSQKYEDAAELFAKAANCYKVSRKWQEAGELYVRVASLQEKCKSAHEAATNYIEAGKCFKNVNPVESINAYRSAIAHYNDMGRFPQAAKMLKEIAEIYEADSNFADAVDSYQQAAGYFQGENSTQAANQCLLKVASIVSQHSNPPDYSRAAQIFEDLGKSCMETRLLQMNAKAHWLHAGLCYLAMGDTVAARQKIDEFKSIDYTFDGNRDCVLLESLTQAVEDFNAQAFTDTAFEYDKISKLDPWKTQVLLKIKRSIQGEGDGLAGGDAGDIDLT